MKKKKEVCDLKVEKARAISDVKAQFVSLVDKAANKRSFLIIKAEKGQASFCTYGKIIKQDDMNHYITGVVYEPMVEDAQGNYMTEEAITKAAYWFAKNGDCVDIQHSFEVFENASVVESWVAKSDFVIGDEEIKKGTWLMTIEVSDDAVWESVKKGEITGFSMGGVGKYSEEDIDLEALTKEKTTEKERRGIFKKFASLLGYEVVEKGVMADQFNQRIKYTAFWDAFYTLEDLLYRYNRMTDQWEFEKEESLITEALSEFSQIIQEILSENQAVAKSLATSNPIIKAGKKISGKNKETLTSIYESLGGFLSEFEEEESEVTKQEVQEMIEKEVKKSSEGIGKQGEVEGLVELGNKETIQKMVDAAIAKALSTENTTEEAQETVIQKSVTEMIEEAVMKAMEPILQSRGISNNLNSTETVQKSEPHYLAGIL